MYVTYTDSGDPRKELMNHSRDRATAPLAVILVLGFSSMCASLMQ